MQLTRRARLIAGVVCLVAGIAGTFYANNADAAAPRRVMSSCSGELGPWQTYTHANFGDLTDLDGDPQADVVIVGDSITTRGYSELTAWLAARGKTLAGSYWSGRPTTPAVDWALSLSTKPKVLVMASGANNIFDTAPVVAGEVARLKAWAAKAPVTRLISVDVQAARTATALCDQRNSMWINSQIRAGMGAGEVCGWSTGFAAQPGRLTMYLEDGIHPIEGVGTAYWAAVVGGCIL